MITLEVTDQPDKSWNERLQSSPYGTIYQTKEYASYIKSRLKTKPLFLKFYSENNEIIAQLLAFQTFKGIKKIDKIFGRGMFYSLAIKTSLLPKFIYWNFGPVVLNLAKQAEVLEKLGFFIKEQKMHFNGHPHPLNTDCVIPPSFNFNKKNEATFVIDLNQNKDTIFKNSNKKSVQKNIERAQERGVKIKEFSTKSDLETYHELLNQFRKERNLTSYSLDDVIIAYDKLKIVGQRGFLAWYEDIPIGSIVISTFNAYINEWGIARSKIDTEQKLYSQELLRWSIIEWGLKNNCKFYDLSGVKISERSKKEEGIFRNKQKWGGKLITYPVYFN